MHAHSYIYYSCITSTSRISLLLHKTEGEAQGRVLITMIVITRDRGRSPRSSVNNNDILQVLVI